MTPGQVDGEGAAGCGPRGRRGQCGGGGKRGPIVLVSRAASRFNEACLTSHACPISRSINVALKARYATQIE
eukprot:3748234-Pyramimonas_sp.AAC.1